MLVIDGGVMLLKTTGDAGGVDTDVDVGDTVLAKEVDSRDVKMPGNDDTVGLNVKVRDRLKELVPLWPIGDPADVLVPVEEDIVIVGRGRPVSVATSDPYEATVVAASEAEPL